MILPRTAVLNHKPTALIPEGENLISFMEDLS